MVWVKIARLSLDCYSTYQGGGRDRDKISSSLQYRATKQERLRNSILSLY